MIQSLPPATRRFIALGLLVVAILLAILLTILPSWSWMLDARTELNDARHERAQSEAIADRLPPPPPTPLSPTRYVSANSSSAAIGFLTTAVSRSADRSAVRLTAITADVTNASVDHIVSLEISAEGSELAILRFIDGVEGGNSGASLQEWKLVKDDQTGAVRLSSKVLAAWGMR